MGEIMSKGEQLSPAQLFDFAEFLIESELGGKASKTTGVLDEAFYNNMQYTIWEEKGSPSFVLFHPSSDNPNVDQEKRNVGTIPFSIIKKTYDKLIKTHPNAVFFVPFAECQGRRSHWTMLAIEQDKCTLYDPKSRISSIFYSLYLKRLKNFLQESGFKDIQMVYAGRQALINDVNCGHYCAGISQAIVKQSKKLSAMQQSSTAQPVSFAQVRLRNLYPQYQSMPAKESKNSDEKNSDLVTWDDDIDLDYESSFEEVSVAASTPPQTPSGSLFEEIDIEEINVTPLGSEAVADNKQNQQDKSDSEDFVIIDSKPEVQINIMHASMFKQLLESPKAKNDSVLNEHEQQAQALQKT